MVVKKFIMWMRMNLKDRLKTTARNIKNEIKVYQAVIKDKRTPLLGRIFLGMAIGYFFLPFDLIPDFIPVVGHIDDLIIIPILVSIAVKLIPKTIVEEHKKRILSES